MPGPAAAREMIIKFKLLSRRRAALRRLRVRLFRVLCCHDDSLTTVLSALSQAQSLLRDLPVTPGRALTVMATVTQLAQLPASTVSRAASARASRTRMIQCITITVTLTLASYIAVPL